MEEFKLGEKRSNNNNNTNKLFENENKNCIS